MSYLFDYDMTVESFEDVLPMAALLTSVILAVLMVNALVKLVIWVFRSLPLYTIARRRGLKNPWLAWIPVGQEWIIGSVSDQYQYLTQDKNRNRRKILLILSLVAAVIGWVSLLEGVAMGVNFITMYGERIPEGAMAQAVLPMTVSMLLGVLSFGVGVAAYVFRQISMYDLYRSCDPKNAVPYLVFGILFGVLEPIFLMILRNRDDGMPPRKTATEEPVNEYL